MSLAAKQRADVVADLPHVKVWLRHFETLARTMPPELWVYVASGSPCAMAKDEHGKIYERGDAVDQDALIENLRRAGGHWDGGDW